MKENKSKLEICRNINKRTCCMSILNNGNYECIALRNTHFENDRCPFHKTQKQADEEAAYVEKRLAMPCVKIF